MGSDSSTAVGAAQSEACPARRGAHLVPAQAGGTSVVNHVDESPQTDVDGPDPSGEVVTALDAGPPHAARGSRARLLWLANAASVLTVVLTLSGHGLAAVGALVFTAALALSGRQSVLATIPTAFLGVLFTTVTVWLAAAWAGSDLFSHVAAARGLLMGLTALALVVTAARHRHVSEARLASRSELRVALPAAVVAIVGVTAGFLPVAVGSAWFLTGADNSSHLLYTVATRSAGALDYSADAYPRGWHALIATSMSASGGPMGSPETLLEWIRLSCLATWGLYAVLVLVTGLCARRMALAMNLRERTAARAGLGAGVTMLTASFFTFTMAMGFQTTILLAFLLLVSAHEVMTAAPPRACVSALAAFVVIAHTWQMALAVAAVPAGASLWRFAKSRAGVRCPTTAALGCLPAAVLAAPPMWSAVTHLGLRSVGAPGGVGRLPVEWLLIGAAAVTVCCRRAARPRGVLLIGAIGAAAIMTGGLVALAAHASLTSYYPTKMFWHAAAVAVPVCCVAVALVASSDSFHRARGGMSVRTPVVVALASAFGATAIVTPLAMIRSPWAEDARATLNAVTQPEARRAQVAWRVTPGSTGDALAAVLLDFYSVGTGTARTAPRQLTHDEACARLRASSDPAVLTSASQQEVSSEFSCAPTVRAIEVTDRPS